MTNREFYNAIVKANLGEDITNHALGEIGKLDKKNAKRKAEAGQVKEENKPIAEAIVSALANGEMISSDLAKAIGQTTQKTNGVAGEMVKIGTLTKHKVKVKGKGEMTSYSLAPTDEVADEAEGEGEGEA